MLYSRNWHSTVNQLYSNKNVKRIFKQKKRDYIQNGILLSHKKCEIMPSAATWMDLGTIILNEVSQRKTTIICYHPHEASNKWYRQTYLQNRNRLTDMEKKLKGNECEKGWIKGLASADTNCYV